MAASRASGAMRHFECDAAQRLLVESQIGTGGVDVAMAEQVPDELDSHTSGEQPHGECMPQAVCVAGGTQLRRPHVLLENVANRVMPQRPIGAASPQEQLGIGSALSIPEIGR